MSRRVRRLLLLLVPLALFAVLGWGWWYMAIGRYPLRGDLRHDFGEVPIYGRSSGVDHTFHLRNVSGRTVIIEQIHQSCGCTDVRASTRTVEPGASVDIEVTLTLARAGKKSANVSLVLSEFGVQRLWVRGVGRKEMALWPNQYALQVARDEPTPVLIFAAIQSSDEEPQAPTVESPEGVAVSFVRWEQVRQRDAARQTAAEWRGTFMVELQAETLPSEASLRIGLGKADPIVIMLATQPAPPGDTSPGEGAEDGG